MRRFSQLLKGKQLCPVKINIEWNIKHSGVTSVPLVGYFKSLSPVTLTNKKRWLAVKFACINAFCH